MRLTRIMTAVAVLLIVAQAADASGKRRRQAQSNQQAQVVSQVVAVQRPSSDVPELPPVAASQSCQDALAEVNQERAKRGLPAFKPDDLLRQAAWKCANLRAASHIHGHLSSDFDQLPSGAQATAAGCGALEPSWGWGTCCTYDNYTYAGAAWVMGSDNRRYMHIFCR